MLGGFCTELFRQPPSGYPELIQELKSRIRSAQGGPCSRSARSAIAAGKRQDEQDHAGLREAVLDRDGRRCRMCAALGWCKRPLAVHRRIWRASFRHAKAGMILAELLPEAARQPALWRVFDTLNAELGRGTVRILSAGRRTGRLAGRRAGASCRRRGRCSRR